MTAPKASPAFVQALRIQAQRIGVDYRPGQGVFDRITGERLDTPGDMVSLFHALDLPYIAPAHRNWEQVISMIQGGNLAAPGSNRPIFTDIAALERKQNATTDPDILTNPRRTIDYSTGRPAGPDPIRVDIHAARQVGRVGSTVPSPVRIQSPYTPKAGARTGTHGSRTAPAER